MKRALIGIITVATLALVTGRAWAPMFGIFPGLSELISRADYIVVAYISDPLITNGIGNGSVQHIKILSSIKGDLKPGDELKTWVRDLPFSTGEVQKTGFRTLHPRGWQSGIRMVFFLKKNKDPQQDYAYRTLNTSGDSFGVPPGIPLADLKGLIPRKAIEKLLEQSVEYERAELKRYEQTAEYYSDSK